MSIPADPEPEPSPVQVESVEATIVVEPVNEEAAAVESAAPAEEAEAAPAQDDTVRQE